MKTECIIHKADGKIVDTSLLKLLFDSATPNGKFRVTIEEIKERTNPQNKYYWLLLTNYIQPRLYDLGYREMKTPEDVHALLKVTFRVKSTSKLSTKEFQIFMDEIYQWSAEFLSIALPSPNTTQNFV